MTIVWHGQACFTLQSSDQKVIIDPFHKEIGLQVPSLEGQLVLVTHDHADHNNISAVSGDPFVVDGAGEYERHGIRVIGIDSYHDDKQGTERGLNTIYKVYIDSLSVAHLGDLGQTELSNEQVERLGEVDVLLIPVGGVYTIDGKDAIGIVHQIQPRVVIPMHYKTNSLKVPLNTNEDFLAEMGAKEVKPQDKFTFKKRSTTEDDNRTEVVVMNI